MHAVYVLRAYLTPRIRRRLVVVVSGIFGVLVAACAPDVEVAMPREVVTPSSSSTTTTMQAPTTTTTTAPTTTTTTVAPPLDTDDVPRVVRTTTDVVLPVLSEVENGLLVRTPCQNTAIVQGGEVEDRVHVVIDPGHGGNETGAVSPDEITEKAVNLEVALLTEARLEELGFEVTLTRYTDIRVPILTRVEIADRLEASLLISIHHQSSDPFPISDEPGTEVFYPRFSQEGKRFAGLLVEESRAELGKFDIDWFTPTDAGAVYRLNANTGGDFYGMIRRPEVTAVLAEMGFMGNEAELALMRTGEMQEAESIAISNAVVRFFNTDDPGSGFVEPSFELTAAGAGGGLSGCEDPDLGETFDLAGELAESFGQGDDSDDSIESVGQG